MKLFELIETFMALPDDRFWPIFALGIITISVIGIVASIYFSKGAV